MIISGQVVVDWVTEKLNKHPHAYGMHAHGIGRQVNGRIVAGVVYSSFNGVNLHAHIASDGSRRWATKEFMRAIFGHPFNTMGARRITATTNGHNFLAQAWLTRAGFEPEAVMAEAGEDGCDVLIYRMFRRECRWL